MRMTGITAVGATIMIGCERFIDRLLAAGINRE
jgi:hypothetical protein